VGEQPREKVAEDDMAEELKIRVNERAEIVMVDPETPLLYVLANDLGLKGPRFGCGSSLAAGG
jgi:aerobic-type carbon monoxide dehydrogenase small subunit (CoxS/CutS family)